MMLGRMGTIRLTEKVKKSLGLCEGIEDGLSLLLAGRAPIIWVATCAGGIERFPVLVRVRELDIYADNGAVGEAAAETLCSRYEEAGRRVVLHWPPDGFGDWDEALSREGGAL
jgi:hypothetical protein